MLLSYLEKREEFLKSSLNIMKFMEL